MASLTGARRLPIENLSIGKSCGVVRCIDGSGLSSSKDHSCGLSPLGTDSKASKLRVKDQIRITGFSSLESGSSKKLVCSTQPGRRRLWSLHTLGGGHPPLTSQIMRFQSSDRLHHHPLLTFSHHRRRCKGTDTKASGICGAYLCGMAIAEQNPNKGPVNSNVPDSESTEERLLKKRGSSNVAVFVSGGGSNFRALHSSVLQGSIPGAIVAVVSDKPGCKGCDYARENGIPVLAFPAGKNAPDGLSTEALLDALRSYNVDFVVLAGYLRLLPAELVRAFPRAILNIHPALLPAFGGRGYYGLKVHEAVIRSGARFSGATVHFVDEKYDTGPIVAQRAVPVFPTDTPHDVAARVLSQEHIVYSEVVAALCDGRIEWREDGVPIIRTLAGNYD